MDRIHPLRAWRKKHDVTLLALADEIGGSISHLSEIETGNKSPSLALAAKLSRVTHGAVPISAFVAHTE